MTIEYPQDMTLTDRADLRRLWKQAFGDPDEFLDIFFSTAYHPLRCRCVKEHGRIVAALYWMDCRCRDRKLAYIYAVATAESHRGRGLCRALMEDTHGLLARQAYAGSILVPGSRELFDLYEKLGYRTCGGIREITCEAGETAMALRPVAAERYKALRAAALPEGGVNQEQGPGLKLMEALGVFYAGEGLCAWITRGPEGLIAGELLGSGNLDAAAPAVIKALGGKRGSFRVPGDGRPFAMYRPIAGLPAPAYFGIAFD